MGVLIACDKFRGSLTAPEANEILADAFAAIFPDESAHAIAIADGGEGTLAALSTATAEHRTATVSGPLGGDISAPWLYDPDSRQAVIEMAAVAGHPAANAGYDPDRATSAGVGELILAALDAGARRIVVAVGGSITVDAGAGALEALGARYVGEGDCAGAVGRRLGNVRSVDLSALDPRLSGTEIILAADVDNPLVGERGAAAVFGPQKGVAAEDIGAFDAALGTFDSAVAAARGEPPLADAPFAGAAGGMLVGLSAAARTTAQDGFALVAEHHGLRDQIGAVDLVVTGEGSLDGQSLSGKGPIAVARMAGEAGVPALLFAGRLAVTRDALAQNGVTAAFSIARGPATLEEALAGAREALFETAVNAFSLWASRQREGGSGQR